VWFEYVSKEAQKAQGFFGELFNWSTQNVPMPQGAYTMIAVGSDTIGGYLATPDGAPPQAHWLTHLQVADAKATSAKVTAAGGRVLKEAFKIGDHGTMAVIADPLGGAFALWQPSKVEASDWKGQASHFVWNELVTPDVDKSLAFYKTIGGFDEVESMAMPDGAYHVLKTDGKPRCGIMKTPSPGVPQVWVPYVQVANTDQTVAKAQKLGASIKMAGEDVPNVGRIAVLTDPLGAPLGLLQPASQR
jgi:hypothetical protein